MADKTIDMLQAATAVGPNDLFVLQQSATAKKLTGQILENWLVALADGHGGIQSIAKTSTSGLVDTYTITYADTTTSTFTVTNGKTMSGVTIYYAVSNSDSTAPSSGWSTSYQQMTQTNRFLWSYEVIAFNDSTSITTEKVVIGVYGQKGDTGATGNGIASMSAGTHTPGEYTLYTITFTDGTSQTLYSYDGVGITSIAKTGTVGLVDTYTITYSDESTSTFTVTNAKSISSVTLTGTSGLVDTYTVAFNDGTSTTFTVTNGASIQSITKTSTVGLVDTYTVALTDGTSTMFTVTNAKSIVSVTQTSGTHAAGTTDVYTITFNDGDTTTFSVYNGANGTGAVSSVDGIRPDGNQNVTLLLTGNGAPTTSTVGSLYQRYFDLTNQVLYICIGVNTSSNPVTYNWAGTGVPVDSSLSTSSENPVQNKVITAKVGTIALTTTATDLSGAVNELNSGKYAKPSGGIPKTDLASGVQTSLGLADTAYQKPSGGIPAADIASGVIPTAYTSNPAMDGTASPGSSTAWAKGDHVHPHDTSKADTGLGITGATVGKVPVISAVNGNGVPTAFDAGDGGDVTADMLGIVINGNSTPVGASVGQYVIVKNSTISGITDGLYTAAQAIPADTAIDSTYLTAVPNGGFNSLLSNIKGLSAVRWIPMSKNSTYIDNIGRQSAIIVGEHIVFVSLNFRVFKEIPSEYTMFSGLPEPAYETTISLAADSTASARAFVKADGTICSDGVIPKDKWYNGSVSYYV